MSRFHKLKIKKINRETSDCITLSLEVPEQLQETFRYNHGQYLTFRNLVNGEEIRRSYSLCSSPVENEWKVAIKKVPEGKFSGFAHASLKAGEEIEVMPPQGKFFTTLHKDNVKHYLAFAAGSGITPIVSIIKTVLHEEPNSSVTLVYGNRARNTIIFKEEIEALKNKYVERLSVHHILSREQGETELLFGRIDKQKAGLILNKIIKPGQVDECFICGPEEMILDVKQAMTEAGIAADKIHFELFASSSPKTINRKVDIIGDESQRRSKVTIRLDGSTRQLDMSYYGDTVLEAALANGADLPYSCKGGMCSTCRARLVKGQVEMDVNYSLEPSEVAAGYILTCQARPLTDEIEVDFDQ